VLDFVGVEKRKSAIGLWVEVDQEGALVVKSQCSG
jgi:hypothetical protein